MKSVKAEGHVRRVSQVGHVGIIRGLKVTLARASGETRKNVYCTVRQRGCTSDSVGDLMGSVLILLTTCGRPFQLLFYLVKSNKMIPAECMKMSLHRELNMK